MQISARNIILGIVLLVILPVACTTYSVFTSVVSAPGRVINRTLRTENIIFNYERFFDINASFEARSNQVKQYKGFLSAEQDPDEKVRLRTELGAMQQSCRELVTSYNADSEKLNRGLFKSRNLPYVLNIGDCE